MTTRAASPLALGLARAWPAIVGRQRGYRVADRALRTAFRSGLSGARRVAHGRARVDYNLDDYVERLMAYEWFGEQAYVAARALLRPGDTYVDAGAHLGYFSAMAASAVGTAGAVWSIEANPGNVQRLRAHSALNANVAPWHVVAGALSPKGGGEVVLHLGQRDIDASLAPFSEGESGRAVAVSTITFDELAAGWSSVALLKIDIEGAEVGAFEGARAWMRSPAAPEVIIAEFNPLMLPRMGASPRALLDLLRGFGYEAYTMAWRGSSRVRVEKAPEAPDLSRNIDLLLCRTGCEARLALL